MRDPIVGIDLGTSNSVVAVADDSGPPRVLADLQGQVIQPTVVSFHPGGSVIVGSRAKQRRTIDPINTVYSAKRLIGRTYTSSEVTGSARRVPYTIKQGVNEQPVVVTRAGEFAIPELSAIVLDHMRGLAQAALRTEITRAVVAVPANFTDAQRTATVTAGDIAGLNVMQAINEPTAAALAYGSQRKLDRIAAVYDFGGGTFDVTLLQVKGSVYEVLATAGDPFLGGDDIDERLVDTMLEVFVQQTDIDLRADDQAIQRLRTVAEQVKIELSKRRRAIVKIDEIAHRSDGSAVDFSMRISRDEVAQHADDLIDRSFSVCEEAMRMAGLGVADIKDIVLVGGTTKMPLVRQRVAEFFQSTPRTDVDPDVAVALGAALQGRVLGRKLGRRKRRTTARGAVVPPAPPMEARASVNRSDDEWHRGKTMTRHMFVEPTLDRTYEEELPDVDPTAETEITVDTDPVETADIPTIDRHREPTSTRGAPARARATATGTAPPASRPPRSRQANTSNDLFGNLSGQAWASRQMTAANRPPSVEPLPSPPPPPRPQREDLRPKEPKPATAANASPLSAQEPPLAGPALSGPALHSRDRDSTAAAPGDFVQARSNPLDADFIELPEARGPNNHPIIAPGAGTGRVADAGLGPIPDQEPGAPGQIPGLRDLLDDVAAADRSVAAAGSPVPEASSGAEASTPIILDVTPHSLGVGTVAGYCRELIRRNARVPTEIQQVFTTSKDLQRTVRIQVCQGESRRLAENVILGDLVLDGIEPRPRGETRIEVLFHIDESGILHVRARDKHTGREQRADLELLGIPSRAEITSASHRLRQLRR